MIKRSIEYVGILAGIILIGSCLLVPSASAQKKKTRPKPLATPPAQKVLTDAEIISRAADEYDQSQVIVDPAAKTTTSKQPVGNKAPGRKALDERLKKLETPKANDTEDKQKALLMNLDILTRAEQRTESLRKQLFEMMDKENSIRARLDQIDYDIRPESIERTLQLAGSMRPEEVRENKRKSLEAERKNLQDLLTTVQSTRGSLSSSLEKAEAMVDKLRAKIEGDIDSSMTVKPDKP